MKLQRCYIGKYRVLRKLDITFRPGANEHNTIALDFLVGPNGCGKSTLLQALTEIISCLERSEPVPFPFLLEYELAQNGSVVVANCDPSERPDEAYGSLMVNGKEGDLPRDLLPKAVMILTTGKEDDWDHVLHPSPDKSEETDTAAAASLHSAPSDHEQLVRRTLSELPGSIAAMDEEEQPPEASRIMLARTALLPLITLCGILTQLGQDGSLGTLKEVFEYAAIQRISCFSLRFRLNEGIAKDADREEVARLAAVATRSLRLGSDRLLVFDLTAEPQNTAQTILRRVSSSFNLYTKLAAMAQAASPAENVLQEVTIFVERQQTARQGSKDNDAPDAPPLLMLSSLSDGERSFLGRICLFSMLHDQEALVLLDEPEVHFNDYWKRQIVYLLEQSLKDRASHALITTHSSITLTDVPKEDIIVLQRSENYTERSGSPRIPTLAADPSDIMVHVFGSPYAAGERGVRRIREALEQVGHRRGEAQRQRLEQLQKQVGPGYWSYRIRHALHQV